MRAAVSRKSKPFCPLYDQKLTEFSEHVGSELHRVQVRLAEHEYNGTLKEHKESAPHRAPDEGWRRTHKIGIFFDIPV